VTRPAEPPKPPEAPKPRPAWPSLLLATGFVLLVCAVLVFLTLGSFGFVPLIAGAIFAFVALHYFLWGWWLGGMIHQDVEEEEKENNNR
jgi:uncharacterized RDD family membrane protein YckC